MLVAEFAQYFFGFTIFISSVFLVMLVLVQRGRGGGLTGALGGPGGQSAFGTKAGDLFTRITVGVAAVWIFLCASAVFFLKDRGLPQTGVTNRNVPVLEDTGSSANPTSGMTGAPSDFGLDLTPPSSAAPSTAITPPSEMALPAETAPASDTAPTDTPPTAEVSDPSELQLGEPATPAGETSPRP